MKLELRAGGVKSTPALLEAVNKRLQLELGRLSRSIEFVRVYLRDENGPRGGVGMRCRVVVELPRRGRVAVSGADPDVKAAISETLNRVGGAVRRHLKQRDDLRRRRRVLPMNGVHSSPSLTNGGEDMPSNSVDL
jgi:hypothetical protein